MGFMESIIRIIQLANIAWLAGFGLYVLWRLYRRIFSYSFHSVPMHPFSDAFADYAAKHYGCDAPYETEAVEPAVDDDHTMIKAGGYC